jgi:peptidoglycan LD-endopeptidase LytH
MDAGWRGLAKAVAITATATSAFWVILGGWLYYRHLEADHPAQPRTAASAAATPSPAPPPAAARPAAPPPTQEAPSDQLIVPVAGVRADQLMDTFTHPRGGGTRLHDAIDIMAPEGTPVLAAAPGRVEKLFLSKDGGNTVYVRSDDGRTIYYYAHLKDYAPGLAEGQQLRRGAPIGSVGYTGDANPEAPHLHFAIMQTLPERKWYEDAPPINPYPLLVGRSVEGAIRRTPGQISDRPGRSDSRARTAPPTPQAVSSRPPPGRP